MPGLKELREKAIVLSWTTTDEINTNQFIIERSKEGIDYKKIGELSATSSPGNHRYHFTDHSPLAEWNFYRLKITDKDGKFSYSSTVASKLPPSNFNFQANPNPATDATTILFKTTTASKFTIAITDLIGKTIQRITGVSVPGNNKVKIDLQHYPAGTYFINFLKANKDFKTIKLIKR